MKQNRIFGLVGRKGSGKTYVIAEYLMDQPRYVIFGSMGDSLGRGGVCDVPLYVPPNLYSNLTGQTLRGGDTTTNPPASAGDLLRAGQR